MPRGLHAPSGGTYTSASAVSAGFGPGTRRMRKPGWLMRAKPMPIDWPQIESSTGLGMIP